MQGKDFFKRWYIRVCRYLLQKKFLRVMSGPLKGYLWSTSGSYDYIMGNYENPDTMKQFLSWIKPGTVVYDLGGNLGYHALAANRVMQSGRIYSFEPVPALRKIFGQHMELNKERMKANHITLLPFAVSDSEKEVEFSNDPVHNQGNTYIRGSSVFTAAEQKITVQCYSIDGLLEQGYEKPDIIKIDVEGAEFDVLKGAIHSLQQFKPHILLATHEVHLPGVRTQCIGLLEQLGYRLQHTGGYNVQVAGIDDYIAIHESRT